MKIRFKNIQEHPVKFKNIWGYSNEKIKFKNIRDFRRPVRTLVSTLKSTLCTAPTWQCSYFIPHTCPCVSTCIPMSLVPTSPIPLYTPALVPMFLQVCPEATPTCVSPAPPSQPCEPRCRPWTWDRTGRCVQWSPPWPPPWTGLPGPATPACNTPHTSPRDNTPVTSTHRRTTLATTYGD